MLTFTHRRRDWASEARLPNMRPTRPRAWSVWSGRLSRTVGEVAVDVRNVRDVTPEVEHNGTVPVWWLIQPREMKDLTDGGYLELANEFEVAVGGEVFPHDHPTHEFYFVMSGEGTMTVGAEQRDVAP